MSWDRGTFELVNKSFTSGFFDVFMPIITNFEFWLIPFGVLWLVFVIRSNRRGRLIALCCFLVVAATDQISASLIKPMVKRIRPCNEIPQTHFYADDQWITTDKFGMTTYKPSYGFPSNHAANICGQAVYWGYFYPQITPALVLATITVGYSRVYMGYHYPSDVLAGYLVGLVVALLIAYPLRVWILPQE
jgi:undecaprenyl-diphosphatase